MAIKRMELAAEVDLTAATAFYALYKKLCAANGYSAPGVTEKQAVKAFKNGDTVYNFANAKSIWRNKAGMPTGELFLFKWYHEKGYKDYGTPSDFIVSATDKKRILALLTKLGSTHAPKMTKRFG